MQLKFLSHERKVISYPQRHSHSVSKHLNITFMIFAVLWLESLLHNLIIFFLILFPTNFSSIGLGNLSTLTISLVLLLKIQDETVKAYYVHYIFPEQVPSNFKCGPHYLCNCHYKAIFVIRMSFRAHIFINSPKYFLFFLVHIWVTFQTILLHMFLYLCNVCTTSSSPYTQFFLYTLTFASQLVTNQLLTKYAEWRWHHI